jgi:hypothetical protein
MNRDRTTAPARTSLRDVADTKPQVSAPTGLLRSGSAQGRPQGAPPRHASEGSEAD